jgi:hypothetical protein
LIRTWDFSHNAINKSEVAVRRRVGFTQIKHGAVFVWKKLGGMPSLDPDHFILSRIAPKGRYKPWKPLTIRWPAQVGLLNEAIAQAIAPVA